MQAAWQELRLVGRVITLREIPVRVLTITILMSLAGLAFGIAQGWSLWVIGLAATIPWLPFFAIEAFRARRAYGWLALFYLLAITQSGHVLEHTTQMIQIHLLKLNPPHNHGIFGQFDIEWVHLVWNSLVLAAILLLTWRFPANRWLMLALAFATWHQIEHSYIMFRFLSTGAEGTPGLLAAGGHLGGGLPITRPDLHFLYNLIETTPLLIAYFWQVRLTIRQD
jgi:hypothetical protein